VTSARSGSKMHPTMHERARRILRFMQGVYEISRCIATRTKSVREAEVLR
jgi:hypothetical protein